MFQWVTDSVRQLPSGSPYEPVLRTQSIKKTITCAFMFVVICLSPSMPGKEKEQFLEYTDVHRKKKKRRQGMFRSFCKLTSYLHGPIVVTVRFWSLKKLFRHLYQLTRNSHVARDQENFFPELCGESISQVAAFSILCFNREDCCIRGILTSDANPRGQTQGRTQPGTFGW